MGPPFVNMTEVSGSFPANYRVFQFPAELSRNRWHIVRIRDDSISDPEFCAKFVIINYLIAPVIMISVSGQWCGSDFMRAENWHNLEAFQICPLDPAVQIEDRFFVPAVAVGQIAPALSFCFRD